MTCVRERVRVTMVSDFESANEKEEEREGDETYQPAPLPREDQELYSVA